MDNRTIYTVGQVNEYIKLRMDSDKFLSDLFIKGEISNFTNHYKTGHFYLTLKDEEGIIRAIMFKYNAQKLKFVPENGMKVICHGRVSAFVKDGSYSIYLDSMEPDGIGALYLAFEQLKEQLKGEGLFDASRKKPLPRYPRTIGIITSPTGAAVRDMINISRRRFPLAKLVLFPCLVQGEGAPAQLCSGIKFFNTKWPVDVIIIGRGGGSLEELWAFNDVNLARMIAASKIPVISAVGHETDFSISDFVSDLRAPTPSAAMELALPDYGEEKERLLTLEVRALNALSAGISGRRAKLDSLKSSRALTDPQNGIDDRRMTLFHLSQMLDSRMKYSLELYKKRLSAGAACLARISPAYKVAMFGVKLDSLSSKMNDMYVHLLAQKKARLAADVSKLHALDPLAVLARGYSAVYNGDGELIKSVDSIKKDDIINLRICDGSAQAKVISTKRSINKDE